MRPGGGGPGTGSEVVSGRRRGMNRGGRALDAVGPLGQSVRMARGRLSPLGALAIVAAVGGGCAASSEPPTFGLPAATLAPVRLVPCPGRPHAAAAAETRCPEEPR